MQLNDIKISILTANLSKEKEQKKEKKKDERKTEEKWINFS